MTKKLTRDDLFSLEKYSEIRNEFRNKVMAHKKNRLLAVGPHVTLHFEDRLIMHYQVQEMLRAEKIFDAAGIEEELNAYNPLIPDGTNFKATMMIEYDDPAERQQALKKLVGIDAKTYVQIGKRSKVYAIADEDLERETEEKTSSVHFLRFELTSKMIADAKAGAVIIAGIDHKSYCYEVNPVPQAIMQSLIMDLI